MSSIKVETILSAEDQKAIVDGVVSAVKRLLEQQPELVDTNAMAVILGVGPATVDRQRRAGKIPSIKIGNRRLFRPAAVIAALEAESSGGASHE